MKFKSYLLFFLLFAVLPDLVITLAVKSGTPVWLKSLVALPTLVTLVYLVLIRMGHRYTESLRVFSYLIFIFAFPKLIFTIVWALTPGLWPAAVAGAAVSLFFLVMIFHVSTHLTVRETDITFPDLPVPELRICQLSDFHLGSYGSNNPYIKRIVDTTLARKPDIILFTGDLVNFAVEEVDSYLTDLARLQAPLGVFAVRGNHDYLLHGCHDENERLKATEKLLRTERDLGWQVLLNDHAMVSGLAVAGVENISTNPYFPATGGDLKKALEGIPEGTFKILLSHDPTHWLSEVVPQTDIRLTLSGHTHGLKFKLAGPNPKSWKFHQHAGLYREGSQYLYVSRGLGSAFAFRLGGYPCVEIITLKRA